MSISKSERAKRERIGKAIRAQRNKLGLSQSHVALQSMLPQYWLSKMERGIQPIQRSLLDRLATPLKTTPEALQSSAENGARPMGRPKINKGPCTREGCENPQRARNLCSPHYHQQRRQAVNLKKQSQEAQKRDKTWRGDSGFIRNLLPSIYEEALNEMPSFARMRRVWDDVTNERYRQEKLRLSGKFSDTLASHHIASAEKLAVLAEEFGEVAREVCELGSYENMRKELVQVAACCVAWCEAIDEQQDKGEK